MRLRVWCVLALGATLLSAGSAGQSREIVLGMSAALSGPSAELGRGMRLGIEAYLRRLNDTGGVGGRRVRLVVRDDSYQAAPVRDNMLQLIDREQVLAIIGNVGTPGATVSVPIANEKKVLLFGAFSGADVLRPKPPHRYVINLRASYAEETAVMVRGLLRRGIKPQQIAFFTQNDAYGDSGYAGAVAALEQFGFPDARSLVHGRYERGTLDVDEALLTIIRARVRPRAVIMVGSYGASAKFIRLAKQALPNALFLNVSFVGSDALIRSLGAVSEGVIVTQVVPHYDSALPGVGEYRLAMKVHAPEAAYDVVSLEGFLAAKILGMAMRKAGSHLTREGVIDAFHQLGAVDAGIGVPLRFAPDEHQGSHHVWLTVVRKEQLMPLEW